MVAEAEVSEARGVITLGGRQFAPPEWLTFAQHAYVMDIVYSAGLDKPGDDLAAFIARVFGTGCVPKLLAGLLVERGVKWSPARAAANAEYFGNLTNPDEFVALSDLVATELLSFFLRAARSSPPSPSFSTGQSTTAPSGETGPTSTVEIGTSSSASSRVSTPSASSTS